MSQNWNRGKYPRVKLGGHSYYNDITGNKFGMLYVESFYDIENSHARFLCKCDCGNEIVVKSDYLLSKHRMSCGCLQQKSRIKHNESKTRLFHIWVGMHDRCYRPSSTSYPDYGGRGISICEDWKTDFIAFKKWAELNGYNDELTIERIDVNGNYEPSNCKFIALSEQRNNTRRSVWIKAFNQKKTLASWVRELNLNYSTIWGRLRRLEDKYNMRGRKELTDRNYDELFI